MSGIAHRSFLLLAIVVHCLGYSAMSAEWSDDLLRWKHRVPIMLSNPGGEMKNHFLLLQLDTQAPIDGKRMRSDGYDIRITDSLGKGLNHWIQNGAGTSTTNIWVKMPSIPPGTTTIYMYYGNASADTPPSAADVFGRRIAALYSFTEGQDSILHDWVGMIDLRLEKLIWVKGFRKGIWALNGFHTGFINKGLAYALNLGSGPWLSNGSFTVIAGVNPSPFAADLTRQSNIVGNFHGNPTDPCWVLTLKHNPAEPGGELTLKTNDVDSGRCEGAAGGVFMPDVWSLAAGKRESGVGKTVYQDGAVLTESCPGDSRHVNGITTFGIGNVDGTNPFYGSISFVAIYDTAYSDAAIAELHKSIVPSAEISITSGVEETLPPPVITGQPTSVTPCLGASVTLSVTATGTKLRYLWRKDGKDIPGATSSTYTIPSVSFADVGKYDVIVRYYTISAPAQITVLTPPSIETQPSSQTVCPGTQAKFSVTGSGPGLTYQWRKNGIPIPGGTNSSYVIPAASSENIGSYDAVVSGSCSPPATSAPATLTLYVVPTITEQPVGTSACRGDFVTFGVAATCTDITYQWRKNGVPIKGATAPQTSVAADWQTQGTYDVVVSGRCQPSVTSEPVQLALLFEPIILEEPMSQVAKPGGSVVFSVKANGGGTLSYQWYKNGIDMPGRTYDTLMLTNVSAADIADYNVIIRGTDCPQKLTTSINAQLYLDVPPAIVTEPQNVTVCQGKPATLRVTATGAGLTYKWRKNGLVIPKATARTLTFTNVTPSDGGSYDVVITSATGQTLTSGSATLTVTAAATIASQPADVTVCPEKPSSLTVGATGSGLSYQWRKNGVDIAGAIGSTFSIAATTEDETGAYSVVVKDTCANTVTSSVAHVRLNEPPIIIEQPLGANVDVGQPVTFSVKATGTSLAYQWRKDGADIPGATGASYTIVDAQPTDAGTYDVVVNGACAPSVSTTPATLTVTTAGVTAYGSIEPGAILLVRPHPAHGPTRLTLMLPQGVQVSSGSSLMLYDMHGNAALDLSESFAQSGYRIAEFDASVLASGIYYCRLSTETWNGTLGSIVVEK